MKPSRWLVAAIVPALLVLSACAKDDRGARPSACAETSAAPVVDVALLAFLSKARALHHEADVAEAENDPGRAIAALDRILTTPVAKPTPPEADEVLADTLARLAELRAARGDFDLAVKDVTRGLEHAGAPTYFRGHLYEVLGLVEEKRAAALTKAGDAPGAKEARKRALDASESAVKIQDEVIKRALEKQPAAGPAPSGKTP